MTYYPPKILEGKLRNKVNINGHGYNIIEHIEQDSMEEAKNLDMEEGITEEYEFTSEYPLDDNTTLTFFCSMNEIERPINMPIPETYIGYYTKIDSCEITKNGQKELVNMDMYIDK